MSGVPPTKRTVWIDLAKGLAILWVVYFHFFTTYYEGAPSPTSGKFIAEVAGANGWNDFGSSVATITRVIWLAVSMSGFHPVGLFVLLSGWSLAATTWRKADKAPIGWREWYWARFIRLYPMYWVAHLVLLITPFTWLEPIDWRFLVSATGLRMYEIESNFMYGNAAWWYFALLIQLVALFPLLFWLIRRLGPWPFLALALAIGFGTRYCQLVVSPTIGPWILGGFGLSRLPEFALGMTLGVIHLRHSESVERWLLGAPGFFGGLILYYFAYLFYQGAVPYIFADLYTGTCCFLVVVGLCGWLEKSPFVVTWLGLVGAFSYGIYLIHQPFVIWIGKDIRWMAAWQFLLIVVDVLFLLSAAGIFLEKRINQVVDRLSGGEKKKPA